MLSGPAASRFVQHRQRFRKRPAGTGGNVTWYNLLFQWVEQSWWRMLQVMPTVVLATVVDGATSARAFLRQAEVMILDEPTTFLDSWSEIDWFERFRELANGRTALLITHRFTIARHADIIHVMEQGRMAESGGHDELLAQGGLYAQSWTAQIQDRPAGSNSDLPPQGHGSRLRLDAWEGQIEPTQ